MNRTPLAWLIIIVLGFSALWAQTFGPDQAEFKRLQQEDLGVLAKKVPHYQIEDLTLEKAANHLWTVVLGREPEALTVVVPTTLSRATLSLDVREMPAKEVLNILAELSACHWTLRGRYAEVLILEFSEIEELDHSSQMLYGDAFALNEEGRSTFGLTSKITSDQIMAALEGYGLNFGEAEWRGFASYNHEDWTLAIAVPKEQLPVARTLVMLANAGKLKKIFPTAD